MELSARALVAFIFFFASFSFARAALRECSRLARVLMKNGGNGSAALLCRWTRRRSLSNSEITVV